MGNTGVKQKNMSGHNVIAEATKATGLVMAQHMQDIAESSRDLERSKIEVQLQLFSEQMAYQRKKDRRLYENVVLANENACLSILKQGEMVTCLAHLSGILSRSLVMTEATECRRTHKQGQSMILLRTPSILMPQFPIQLTPVTQTVSLINIEVTTVCRQVTYFHTKRQLTTTYTYSFDISTCKRHPPSNFVFFSHL